MTAATEIPVWGGRLCFSDRGTASCPSCGWSGIPTLLDGVRVGPVRAAYRDWPRTLQCVEESRRSTYCPVCEEEPGARPRKVGRNEPCPCGSGRKFKRCCG